jgi:two-component system phosphate regulon sensor histidine kinase PhoR
MVDVLEVIDDAVLLVARDGGVRWLNAAARRLFAAPEQALDRPLLEVVRDHRLNALAAQAAATAGEHVSEVDLPVSGRVLRARASRLGSNHVVALIVKDVTRLRHMEAVRQQFVANLSHEIRTPLAGLDLAAQTLAGQLGPGADAWVFVDRILQETQRLAAILRNLTQLAALDAEQIRVEPRAFSVSDLLEENIAREASRAKALGLSLRAEVDPAGIEAFADRAMTDEALQSIVDNALKFTSTGEIVLAASADANIVEIAVKDTGVGIPSRDLPRIFERFYKVDRARGGDVAGTGLGLSIARHLIELQGGTVSAESTPGVGTVMRTRLPRAGSPQPQP